jgi:hypothetical protein
VAVYSRAGALVKLVRKIKEVTMEQDNKGSDLKERPWISFTEWCGNNGKQDFEDEKNTDC